MSAGLWFGTSLVALTALAAPSAAQIPQPGQPPVRPAAQTPGDLPAYVLPAPDVARLQLEDAARNDWPLRYGAVIPTALSTEDSGEWESLPSGELAWRLRIASPGARSMGVLFDRFELPASGRVFLYDLHRTTVLGAFTRQTRQPNGMLAVQPVPGQEVWIEYVQDAADPGRPSLRLGEVVHDYRGILDELRVDSALALTGGGCLVDANCPDAKRYYDIKSSTIMVLMGGGMCSAGLVNNTANNGTPYFMTAHHCGNMTNVVAVFDYERTGCGVGFSSQSKTISGATQLAASPGLDSQLYRLSSAPPESYRPFYAGWDRNADQPIGAFNFSHPSGAPRKFARDDQRPKTQTARFQVDWEVGMLEGGSSGSPLFNAERRFIGPACCVTVFACGVQTAWYGRFDLFWTEHALAQWLDPLNTGATAIDGHDPFRGQAFWYNGSNVNFDAYYSTSPPSVGATWTAAVDPAVLGPGTRTVIFGHLSALSGVFAPPGELLVALASPRIFISSVVSATGAPVTHTHSIPDLPILVGLKVYSQGMMLLGGGRFFTNGLELRLN